MPGSKRKAVSNNKDDDLNTNMVCGRKRDRNDNDENKDSNIMTEPNPMSQLKR